MLVSPASDDATERAPGEDVVSVVSNLEMDSDLGPTKEEEADFCLITWMRLMVAESSDLSEVRGPVGVMWALGVVTAMSVSTEEALSARSLPCVCSDHGLEDEYTSLTGSRACCSAVIVLSLRAMEGMTVALTYIMVLSSDLPVTGLMVPLAFLTTLVAES